MQRIEVNDIRVYAYHGCLPEEAKIGGEYLIDLWVDADFSPSYQSDKLADTVDYVLLNKIVAEEMAIRSKLIEHVGYRILTRIKKENTTVETAGIRLRKLSPPINGNVGEVAVVMEL